MVGLEVTMDAAAIVFVLLNPSFQTTRGVPDIYRVTSVDRTIKLVHHVRCLQGIFSRSCGETGNEFGWFVVRDYVNLLVRV